MRRVVILPALMIALLLSGCGSDGQWENKIEAKRQELCASEQMSFTASITANMGDSEFLCKLKCTSNPEETVMEVIEPEIIAGVKARAGAEDASIEYDGVLLSVGELTEDGLTPIASVPVIIKALKEGHITQLWREKNGEQQLVAMQVYVTDDVYAKVWLAEETLYPVHAELVSNNKVIINCDISDFSVS